jgi:hypothetical protein
MRPNTILHDRIAAQLGEGGPVGRCLQRNRAKSH